MEEEKIRGCLPGIDEIKSPANGVVTDSALNEIVPVFMQLYEQLEQQNNRLQEIRQELEQSRNDFESLFENAPFAYVVVNREAQTLSCNAAAKKLLYCAQAKVGSLENFREVVSPEKQAEFDAFMHELKNTKTPAKLPSIVINKVSGKQLEVIIHAALNKPIESGNILLSIEDVTEKNKAVRELKQNENAISTIGEHITDLLLMSDLEGNVEYASPACRMLEYTEEEMLQMQLFDFVHPADLPALMENFSFTMMNEKTGFASFRILTKSGNSFWIESNGSVVHDDQGNAEKAVFVVRDIRKQKETERALVESEKRFRSLFVNKHTPMLLVDLEESRLVDLNPAAVEFFGYQKEDLLKMTFSELSLLSEEEIAGKIEMAGNLEKVQFEMKIKKADGNIIDAEVFGGLTELQDEKLYYIILQDVSERLLAKKQVLENAEMLHNLNVTKYRLFSVIAHDLRNPIGSIMTLTELLREQQLELLPEEVENITAVIRKTAANTFELLENLLDWSRIQRGIIQPQLQTKPLAAFIDELFDEIGSSASNKNIKLRHEIEPGMKAEIDSNILETILRNLLSNAIKFSYRNSTVWVHAQAHRQKGLVIEVRDEGIGMDNEMVSQLFKVDETVGRPGTEGEKSSGLGLIICNDYTAMLNGKIYAKSTPNNGSSFFVELPQ